MLSCRQITCAPKCPNPKCDKVLDRLWDPFGERRPVNGDITVCAYCVQLAVIQVGPDGLVFGLRKPDPDELAEAMGDPEVMTIITRLRDNMGGGE